MASPKVRPMLSRKDKKNYRNLQPSCLCAKSLCYALQDIKSNSDVWCSRCSVGKDKLGKVNVLSEQSEHEGRNVNHPCRKIFTTTLVQAGRPFTEIALLKILLAGKNE